MAKPFKDHILDYITAHHLLSANGSRVLVALSGGADSVALLRVFDELGISCYVVHCNFHLRGDESLRDELFVCNLCQSLDIPCEVIDFDTRHYAAEKKISIEMAARELRYDAFERIRQQQGLDAIAVAHHAEDSVETMLLNLMRGTGIQGLTGIKPMAGHIIRPLLDVTRQDIVGYLHELHQDWVEDSSNATDDYARNKVRHHLIPLMQEICPSAIRNMLVTANNLQGTCDLLNERSTDAAAMTLLHSLLHPYGYNGTQIGNLLEALRNHKQTLIPSKDTSIDYQLVGRMATVDKQGIPHSSDILCLDVRQLTDTTFTLRRWHEGDRFCPFGMHGRTKLISDLLTDHHLSRYEREHQQVLLINDAIAWVVGLRSDERFKVPDDARQIVMIEKKLLSKE